MNGQLEVNKERKKCSTYRCTIDRCT